MGALSSHQPKTILRNTMPQKLIPVPAATEELSEDRIPRLIRRLEQIEYDRRFRRQDAREVAIKQLCDREVDFLRHMLDIKEVRDETGLGQKIEGSVHSLHSYLADYRNAVRKLKLTPTNSVERIVGRTGDRRIDRSHLALKYLVKSPLEKQQRGERDVTQKRNKARDRVEISPLPLIARSEQLLNSRSYAAIALGLILLTGRRPIEILKLGFFVEDGDKLRFSGQAKTKGSNKSRDNYLIPCLCSREKAIAALDRIRQQKNFSENDNRYVQRKTGKTLREQYDRYFSDIYPVKEVPPYSLRAAYGAICWDLYGKYGFDDDQHYLSLILGHSDEDDDTARHYKRFKLVS